MARTRFRLTLGRFVGFAFGALALLLVVLLSVFYGGSRRTILVGSEQLMRQASQRVTERIEEHLAGAERLVGALEAQAALGLLAPADVERALVAALTEHPQVTEATFTFGTSTGVYEHDEPPHDAGDLVLVPERSGQVGVSRPAAGDAGIVVRRLQPGGGGWTAAEHAVTGGRTPAAPRPPATVADPTTHPTFTVPSRPEFRGRLLWSDLAFAEADAARPEAERRRVVSVQKALWSADGRFLGVVRVSLQSERIDALTHLVIDDAAAGMDDHVVFLADRAGRLISRLGPDDRFGLLDPFGQPNPDGDVRVVPANLPPAVAAALASPAVRDADRDATGLARLRVDGVEHLLSVSPLLGERSQGWLVGIVVPEAHYLGGLAAAGRRALVIGALLTIGAAVAAWLMLRALNRDLGRLIGETTHLRSFDFSASADARGTFDDVRAASSSLEQAKTALRALGKYVPLDLVRQLYDARIEPALGAELQDVTLLFSDIEGFTTLAEALEPDALARALGAYLDAMTRAIHATGGIIDKYTGDGVMALWNTPRPIDGHAVRACEAALACRAATDALFASSAWGGRAPWRTRFGIHRAVVNVGHFGAPDRMSFTAMGDGVNLASRLEGLGKQYGVYAVVSDAVEREARSVFRFRRLDRVAVKGKHEGVLVFELLGGRSPGDAPSPAVTRYEHALDAYFDGRFADALALLADADGDPPSRVLAARCRRLAATPPLEWRGVWTASEK